MKFKFSVITAISLILLTITIQKVDAANWDAIYQPDSTYPQENLSEEGMYGYPYRFPLTGIISAEKAELLNMDNIQEAIGTLKKGQEVTIIGRREKGMSLGAEPYFQDIGPYVELYTVESEDNQVGYVKAVDIARVNKTILSPKQNIKIISDVIGCSFNEPAGGYLTDWGYWLSLPENNYFYLGSRQLTDSESLNIEWSPDEEYFYAILRTDITMKLASDQWPVSKIFWSSGELAWKSASGEDYLASPAWLPRGRVVLRGLKYDDSLYSINLKTGQKKLLLKYTAPLPYEHKLDDGIEALYHWPPAEYEPETKRLKATFKRVKKYSDEQRNKQQLSQDVIYKQVEITVTLNLDGDVISTKVRDMGPFQGG